MIGTLTVLTLLASWLVRQFWSWYRLRHIPGPFSLSISRLMMFRQASKGQLHENMREWDTAYGPLVRVGPKELIVSDPEVIRAMSSARSVYTKGEWYGTWRVIPGQDHIFSMRDEGAHRELKRKMAPGFSKQYNPHLEQTIDKHVVGMVDLIEKKYITTERDFRPVEFAHLAMFFTIDVISDLSWGEPLGFLVDDVDKFDYLKLNDTFFPFMTAMSTLPSLTAMMQRAPFKYLLPKSGDRVGFGRIMWLAESVVDRSSKRESLGQGDILTSHASQGLDRQELLNAVLLQLMAGSDTTASAIRMTLLFLMNNPAAYARLREEIDQRCGVYDASFPIKDADAQSMPYLQAVIRESFRVFPPVPGFLYKRVPRGGATISGYFVPEGTQVGHNLYSITTSKKIWGEDADVFRPERWFEFDEERFREGRAIVDLCFGHGKYECMGKVIAFMEISKVIVELVRRYDLTVANPLTPMKLACAGIYIASDFWVKVTRR